MLSDMAEMGSKCICNDSSLCITSPLTNEACSEAPVPGEKEDQESEKDQDTPQKEWLEPFSLSSENHDGPQQPAHGRSWTPNNVQPIQTQNKKCNPLLIPLQKKWKLLQAAVETKLQRNSRHIRFARARGSGGGSPQTRPLRNPTCMLVCLF